MGSTLTNTQPKDTYKSLLKTSDSSELSATAKTISDGNGNDSVLTLSTNSVGIGSGPMPSTSTYAHFHPGSSNSIIEGGGDLNLANNAYYSTSWKRKLSSASSMVYQYNGKIDFMRAAGGTANSNLTWNTIASVTENGLTFNGDTAAANALDDYEEGTWTPEFYAGNYSYNFRVGKYTKIGNVVTANFVINWSANNLPADTSAMQINLPFATSSTANFRSTATIGYVSGITISGIQIVSAIGPNSTLLDFYDVRSGISPVQIINSGLAAGGGEIQLSMSYLV